MAQYRTGVFVRAGGNKVFFANGVLSVFRAEGIPIDKIVGLSSSSAIIMAYILNKTEQGLDIFAKTLDANKKNFYFFRRNHFPHSDIYKNAVKEILQGYRSEDVQTDFVVLATSTNKACRRTKAFLSSLVLLLHATGINLLAPCSKILNLTRVELQKQNVDSIETLLDFIMGSSTLYPFIQPHTVEGKLILEGGLLGIDYRTELSDCDKKIVIHNENGNTAIQGDTLHIYADEPIPRNILDYTNGNKVRGLHRIGQRTMRAHLTLLKNFLNVSVRAI
jgi:predicted acylesterase/phospholipase RssA